MTPSDRDKLDKAITRTFMWNFKKGDNIVYNLEVLGELYEARGAVSMLRKPRYIKPIVLLQVSIIECILDDFVNRVQGHVSDKVPNITQAQINEFKTKKYDKLEHYISVAKKYNLFDSEPSFYDDLDSLRTARNRVHIQNSKFKEPANESRLFTDSLLHKSENAFEVVLQKMMTKFFRRGSPGIRFSEVPLPWPRVNTLVVEDEPVGGLWICVYCTEVNRPGEQYCRDCMLPR